VKLKKPPFLKLLNELRDAEAEEKVSGTEGGEQPKTKTLNRQQ